MVDLGQTDNPSPDPANEGGALRSQDLRTPADPVTLDGSIIRVQPDTGKPVRENTSMTVGTPTVDVEWRQELCRDLGLTRVSSR